MIICLAVRKIVCKCILNSYLYTIAITFFCHNTKHASPYITIFMYFLFWYFPSQIKQVLFNIYHFFLCILCMPFKCHELYSVVQQNCTGLQHHSGHVGVFSLPFIIPVVFIWFLSLSFHNTQKVVCAKSYTFVLLLTVCRWRQVDCWGRWRYRHQWTR